MITTNGRNVIKRYIAGQIPNIADGIAFGVGTAPEGAESTDLDYEILRVPVTSINADLANDRLVFKCSIQPGAIRSIYEVGLVNGDALSRNLNLFGTALWSDADMDAEHGRAGAESLRVDYVANGTTNAELIGLYEDFSSFDDSASVAVAFEAGANLSSVRIRFGSDSANYYEFVINGPFAGYNIYRLPKSDATVTGSPNWSAITYLAVRPSATAGGAGSIFLDAIRFEHNSILDNSILVARTVLDQPSEVDAAIPTDVEYSLEISFT